MSASIITFKGTVAIPDEDIEVLIEMAGYGISYWANSAVVDSEARTYTVTADEEGAEPVAMTYGAIAETLVKVAFSRLGETYVSDDAREYFKDMDAGVFDADLGDVVIQLTAFDELIYG